MIFVFWAEAVLRDDARTEREDTVNEAMADYKGEVRNVDKPVFWNYEDMSVDEFQLRVACFGWKLHFSFNLSSTSW